METTRGRVKLPAPRTEGDISLEQSLLKRRSIRKFSDDPLSLSELGQLLWAAQGRSTPEGRRTSPSVGALYPLEVYVFISRVTTLVPGIYRYNSESHELNLLHDHDQSSELARAALDQDAVRDAALNIVFTAVWERITWKYGQRGIQYTHQESGHAAQNLCLQATALDLGTVLIGAFIDEEVNSLLDVPSGEDAVYIISVGNV